jgi:hypothetical protein
VPDEKARLELIRTTMAMLPPANKALLTRLLALMRKGTIINHRHRQKNALFPSGYIPCCCFCCCFALIDLGAPPVADHADTNKMHAQNLAIVFAPCLLRPVNDDLLYASPPHHPHPISPRCACAWR